MALLPGARTVAFDGGIRAAWSDASRGDLRPTGTGPRDAEPLARLVGDLAADSSGPISHVAWAIQVHGHGVVEFDLTGPSGGPGRVGEAGRVGETVRVGDSGPVGLPEIHRLGEHDALISSSVGVALCVLTADCGALALASPEGVFAAVHAGWRGLTAGVVEATVERMRRMGATDVTGALGPTIHAGCYEFGVDDLDAVVAVYGEQVRGRSDRGGPALDLGAGIAAALERAGARSVVGVDVCTACGGGYYSHRARGDTGRQALVVWSAAPPSS